MRVGVTGATGFLGSHVVRRLSERGYEVIALRREASSTARFDGLPLEWRIGDLGDATAARQLVEGCDLVVHAASPYVRGRGDSAGATGTQVLVDACRGAGVHRLVHVSSAAAVNPGSDGTPADERTPFGGEGKDFEYYRLRRHDEAVVISAVRHNLDAVIVNPGFMVGPYAHAFRGADLIERVLRRPVVHYGRGGTTVVHVDDVAAGVILALDQGRPGNRYLLAGENHTWRRLFEIAADTAGLRRALVRIPRRPRLSRRVYRDASRCFFYDSEKAVRELGYSFRPYREIVGEYLSLEQGRDR